MSVYISVLLTSQFVAYKLKTPGRLYLTASVV
jgi:hypothetical protein